MIVNKRREHKYKLVRRGQKYCVRVKGSLNTTDAFSFCRERKMSYHIKQHWNKTLPGKWWAPAGMYRTEWDYDFIFDKEYEATAFIMGYL